ncbi:MAG TPA: transglutaminase family protein [Propionibacteriaceae bacterium]|nr:transglutaminase family protein [Propionibacteriaceae bacterium]
MTTYHIEHRTTYTYDSEVTGSYGQVHLRPRDLAWQTCMAHEITIDPEPADLFRHIDLYGNEQAYFHVVQPHTRLVVTSTSVVNVEVNNLDPGQLATPWEQALPRSRQDDGEAWEVTDFTFPSRYVEIPRPIQDYARPSFPAGRPIGQAVVELMHRIHGDFTYKSGSTTLTTKVSDLLEKRTGVCQDFAHVMVASLRSLGLAGRYVSGYLATRPAPGKPRQVEDAASHAWVGCWIPDAGWLYLDPTNDRLIDDSHATVAWGRDYGDVPPVMGVIFTEAKKSTMDVSVDMAEM